MSAQKDHELALVVARLCERIDGNSDKLDKCIELIEKEVELRQGHQQEIDKLKNDKKWEHILIGAAFAILTAWVSSGALK